MDARMHSNDDIAETGGWTLLESRPVDARDPLDAMTRLVEVVQQLSLARSVEQIAAIVRVAARELTGADGATFVLREGDCCFYADENAIQPLWKGQRFPMSNCVSGWAMTRRLPVVIPDVFADPRVPRDVYRETFVKSMAMVPIRTAAPIGAIGNYWAQPHVPTPAEVSVLQALANTAAVAMENVRVWAELERRVEQRTRELDRMNQELEAFSYSISHDLRAPLRAIHGFCQIYLEDHGDTIPEAGRPIFDTVIANTSRMGALIEDLLRFSKLSRQSIVRQPVSLDAMIRRVLDAERAAAAPERLIEVKVEPLGHCAADPSLLEQVFVNLVSNAFKFTRHRLPAQITIGSNVVNGERCWFVRDNGAGFDMRYANKLFVVFQRLHAADTFEGTGVGLSLVQRIVQRHGGRIWAESAPEQGATFHFTLGT